MNIYVVLFPLLRSGAGKRHRHNLEYVRLLNVSIFEGVLDLSSVESGGHARYQYLYFVFFRIIHVLRALRQLDMKPAIDTQCSRFICTTAFRIFP